MPSDYIFGKGLAAPPGAGSVSNGNAAPVGYASLPVSPQPIRLAQNGPLLPGSLAPPPSMPAAPATPSTSAPPMFTGPAFGSLAGPRQPQLNPAYVQWLRTLDQLNAALGRKNPVSVEESLKMLPGFSMSPEYLQQKAAAEGWGGIVPKIHEQWNTPKTTRLGVIDPRTGQVIGAMPQLEKVVDPATGREMYRYMSPTGSGMGSPGFVGGDLGVAKLAPYEIQAGQTRAEKEQTDRQQVITEANAAQQSRATLMKMTNETGNFVQGPRRPCSDSGEVFATDRPEL